MKLEWSWILVNACQINIRQKNVELMRLHNENVYLGETLLDDIPPLLVITPSLVSTCINCGTLLFHAEHGKTKHNPYHSMVKLNSPGLIILRP